MSITPLIKSAFARLLAAKVEGKPAGLLVSKTAWGATAAGGAELAWAPIAETVLQTLAPRLGFDLDAAAAAHVVELALQVGGGLYALYGYLHARRSSAKAA